MYNFSLATLRLLIGVGLIGSVIWQVTDRIANDLFRPFEYFAYFSIVTAIVAGLFLITTSFGLMLKIYFFLKCIRGVQSDLLMNYFLMEQILK